MDLFFFEVCKLDFQKIVHSRDDIIVVSNISTTELFCYLGEQVVVWECKIWCIRQGLEIRSALLDGSHRHWGLQLCSKGVSFPCRIFLTFCHSCLKRSAYETPVIVWTYLVGHHLACRPYQIGFHGSWRLWVFPLPGSVFPPWLKVVCKRNLSTCQDSPLTCFDPSFFWADTLTIWSLLWVTVWTCSWEITSSVAMYCCVVRPSVKIISWILSVVSCVATVTFRP